MQIDPLPQRTVSGAAKREIRLRPLVPVLTAAGLVIASGALWLLRGRVPAGDATSASPVQVFVISPRDLQEVESGDYLQIRTIAFAPEDILETSLFIDDQPLGPSNGPPQNAWWIWRAWQPGIHSVYAQSRAADGQAGRSATVLINVIAGSDTLEVLAEDGETLQQIGVTYGIPPVQMADANPRLDPNPSLPLAEGERVRVPVPRGGGQAQLSSVGVGGEPSRISILWTLEFNQPVDRSYCYARTGGDWYRIPREPLLYFEGAASTYTQLVPMAPEVVVDVECRGWVAGELKLLGQAAATFNPGATPASIVLRGQSFVFTGTPRIPGAPSAASEQQGEVPFPYSLRQPLNVGDCAAHGLAQQRCEDWLATNGSDRLVLEWEWRAPFCPAGLCGQVTSIDGFHIYVMDVSGAEARHVDTILDPGQRITAIPLAYGAQCYGVRAYADTPVYRESEMARYCPGRPATDKLALEPRDSITTGQFSEEWFDDLALPEGAVTVSAANYGSETRSSAGLEFDLPAPPAGAVLNRATLRFAVLRHQQGANENAEVETLCADALAVGLQDWTSLSGGENRYMAGVDLLSSPGFSAPVASLPDLVLPDMELDVTAIVSDWLENPSTNHGFVLQARPSPLAGSGGGAFCQSVEGNFVLELEYLSP